MLLPTRACAQQQSDIAVTVFMGHFMGHFGAAGGGFQQTSVDDPSHAISKGIKGLNYSLAVSGLPWIVAMARPTGIEPVSRASETLILSIELRAQRGGIVPKFLLLAAMRHEECPAVPVFASHALYNRMFACGVGLALRPLLA
jgi:hypothetical protein